MIGEFLGKRSHGAFLMQSHRERQSWRCSHCLVWGSAVWAVRDGPYGPRVRLLCPEREYDADDSSLFATTVV